MVRKIMVVIVVIAMRNLIIVTGIIRGVCIRNVLVVSGIVVVVAVAIAFVNAIVIIRIRNSIHVNANIISMMIRIVVIISIINNIIIGIHYEYYCCYSYSGQTYYSYSYVLFVGCHIIICRRNMIIRILNNLT